MPEISVVIPSYNHAIYIEEAVTSVLNQTIGDLELIVVDDGSTDHTLQVLYGITDPRMQIIAQENRGAHAAINRGLQKAKGAYLAILNSDDVYHPQRLEKALSALRANPRAGFVGSFIEIIDNQGKSLGIKHGYADCSPWPLENSERSFRSGTDLHAALLTENYWSTTSNFFFTRAVYQQVGDFRPLRYAHDWDYALRIANVTSPLLLPEPLVKYRIHPSNTIRENRAAMIFEICWILAVHLPRYITNEEFFDPIPLSQKIERLLYSIYTFEMDRVLSVMLLQRLYENQEQALVLLNPDDPCRAKYLEFIAHHLEKQSGSPVGQPVRDHCSLIRGLLRRLKALPRGKHGHAGH